MVNVCRFEIVADSLLCWNLQVQSVPNTVYLYSNFRSINERLFWPSESISLFSGRRRAFSMTDQSISKITIDAEKFFEMEKINENIYRCVIVFKYRV